MNTWCTCLESRTQHIEPAPRHGNRQHRFPGRPGASGAKGAKRRPMARHGASAMSVAFAMRPERRALMTLGGIPKSGHPWLPLPSPRRVSTITAPIPQFQFRACLATDLHEAQASAKHKRLPTNLGRHPKSCRQTRHSVFEENSKWPCIPFETSRKALIVCKANNQLVSTHKGNSGASLVGTWQVWLASFHSTRASRNTYSFLDTRDGHESFRHGCSNRNHLNGY